MQKFNNDTYSTTPVTSAQYKTGTEIYPDAGLNKNYPSEDYSEGCQEIEEIYGFLIKDRIPQTNISDQISDPTRKVMGLVVFFIFWIYDSKKNFTAAQTKK